MDTTVVAVKPAPNKAAGKKALRARKATYDVTLLIVTLVLVLFGIIMVFSASYYYAENTSGDGLKYFKSQLMGAALGGIAIFLLMRVNYKRLEKLKWAGLIISFVLLGLVFIDALNVEVNNASRWLKLGPLPAFQPAEIAKFAIVLFIASQMSKNRANVTSFFKGIVPILAVTLAMCGLILLQPNFSMVVALTLITFVMLFVGGAKLTHLGVIMAGGVAAGVYFIQSAEYRLNRYLIFLDPWVDPKKNGYQLIQSLYAIGAGGIFGTGLGNSKQKLLYLPYGESDFIFSILAEELGLFGVILLLTLYAILIWRGIRIAVRCEDMFGTMLAAGITAVIGIQVLINIAVATGSIPPTGLPLPFISAGNTSLMMLMASIGILLNISKSAQNA